MGVELSVTDLALAVGLVWIGFQARRGRQTRERLEAVAIKYQTPSVVRLED